MRKLIIRIQEFFQTQKTAEQATVSLGELQQWSDLQYKPLLKNTYELMRKQLIACKDARKDLSLAIKEIEEFSVRNQRVDVQTKILNKRHLLLKNLKELQVLLNGVDELEDLFKIYGFFKKLQKLNQDIKSLLDIEREFVIFVEAKQVVSIDDYYEFNSCFFSAFSW